MELIFLRPSTIWATLGPKMSSTSEIESSPLATFVCNIAQMIEVRPSPISVVIIKAISKIFRISFSSSYRENSGITFWTSFGGTGVASSNAFSTNRISSSDNKFRQDFWRVSNFSWIIVLYFDLKSPITFLLFVRKRWWLIVSFKSFVKWNRSVCQSIPPANGLFLKICLWLSERF